MFQSFQKECWNWGWSGCGTLSSTFSDCHLMDERWNTIKTSLRLLLRVSEIWLCEYFEDFSSTKQFPHTIWGCGDELLDRHPMSQTSCIASMVNFDAWDWVVGVMFKSSLSICYQ